MGTLAYRSAYASVFDTRYNHIPLLPLSAKTWLSYSIDCGPKHVHPLAGRYTAEVDKMVVWNWWQRSEPSDIDSVKEMLWLQSLRRVNIRGTCDGKGEPVSSNLSLHDFLNRVRETDTRVHDQEEMGHLPDRYTRASDPGHCCDLDIRATSIGKSSSGRGSMSQSSHI